MTRYFAGDGLEDVRAALATIRSEGLSITSGELDPGLTGIAAPLSVPELMPTGSLALVVADARVNAEIVARAGRLLRAAAEQVSLALNTA